jgi:ribosome-associated translation inhibitor RaiA
MRVEFHILGLKADNQLHHQLASDLQHLNDLIPITCADISLARQHDSTPPFQAAVLLGVPGPDIHAAARDHTWPAAWLKVVARLREQIEARQNRQQARQRGPRHLDIAPRRTNGVPRTGRT